MTHDELKEVEGGMLLLSGKSTEQILSKLSQISIPSVNFDNDPSGVRLSFKLQNRWSYDANDNVRMALIATSWAELSKRIDLVSKAIADKGKWGFLASQGILVTDEDAMPEGAKVAHMYPGQGSQYVGMTLDLYKRFKGVQDVWAKSDITMSDVLGGELSSFVLRTNLGNEEKKKLNSN